MKTRTGTSEQTMNIRLADTRAVVPVSCTSVMACVSEWPCTQAPCAHSSARMSAHTPAHMPAHMSARLSACTPPHQRDGLPTSIHVVSGVQVAFVCRSGTARTHARPTRPPRTGTKWSRYRSQARCPLGLPWHWLVLLVLLVLQGITGRDERARHHRNPRVGRRLLVNGRQQACQQACQHTCQHICQRAASSRSARGQRRAPPGWCAAYCLLPTACCPSHAPHYYYGYYWCGVTGPGCGRVEVVPAHGKER